MFESEVHRKVCTKIMRNKKVTAKQIFKECDFDRLVVNVKRDVVAPAS